MRRLIPFGSAVKYLTEIALTAGILLTVLQETMGQTYSNVAPAIGINIQNADLDWGGGVSFFDYDQDGTDDLTFADSLRFYDNKESGIKLSPDTFFSQKGLVSQVLWFDYDNDGDNDAFISYRELPNELYENTGDLSFSKKADSIINLSSFSNNTFGVAAGDYNRDGYLDLYVCNYENSGSQSNNSFKYNKLYRNNGNGTFTLADSAGVADGAKPSFQGIWIDYNQDNWPDLYVVNDLTPENSLYRNNGDGTFTEVTNKTKSGLAKHHPMSATAGDFNNNGHLDIYMSNSNLRGRFIDRSGKLLKNTGNGSFREEAKAYGVDIKDWSWGSVWVDYNNDGYQDLYVTTATLPLSQMELNPDILYENVSADTFRKKPDIFLDTIKSRSFAAAKGDLDNDGYYDLFTQNMEPKKARLWKNSDTSNNYVKVTLNGTFSNRMAIGSWIRVYADSKSYSKYTKCGANYLSQNSQHKIFGVGTAKNIDSIVVEYLSGYEDQYYNLTVDTHYYFMEGETENFKIQTPERICYDDSFTLSVPKTYDSIWWNTNDTGQFLRVYKSGFYWVKARTTEGITFSDTVKVPKGPGIHLNEQVKHVACNGDKNGKIDLKPKPDSLFGNARINWSNGSWGLTNDSLGAGQYIYYLIDGSGCGFQDTIDIREPSPLNLKFNRLFEAGKADSAGILDLTVNGGNPPYQIRLNGDKVGKKIQGLPVDTYSLQIIDEEGCKLRKKIPVQKKPIPKINVVKTSPTCAGEKNGKIKVTLPDSALTRKYRIKWQKGFFGNSLQNLSSGKYTYTYTDNKGAKVIDTVQLVSPDSIKMNPEVQHRTNKELGSIELAIEGGEKPYEVFFEGKQVQKDSFQGLEPGLYKLKVKDSSGCVRKRKIRIKDSRKPDIDVAKQNVSCAGEDDGQIILNIPEDFQSDRHFSIQWDDRREGTKRTGLSPGNYIFHYMDSLEYSFSDTVSIQEPDSLKPHIVTITKNEKGDCLRNLKVKGGASPYRVRLNGKLRRHPVKNLPTGKLDLLIIDRQGCQLDTTLKIEPSKITNVEATVEKPSCANSSDGKIKLDTSSLSNTAKPVSIKWINGAKGPTIHDVTKGTYYFQALPENNGCTYEDSVFVQAPFPIDVRKQIVRTADNTFKLDLAINGGTAPYTIQLDGEQVKEPIDNITRGKHVLEITDQNNCEYIDSVRVGEPSVGLTSGSKSDKLKIQPNPVNKEESIMVSSPVKGEQITTALIVNMRGQLLNQVKFTHSKRQVNISMKQVPSGMYILRVRLNKKLIQKPLMIK